ncbi:MAG: carbohydrate ABC transporter permease [Chthonomonadaceae bacterium]|nr:carbohydrate ABC transporter permease [Chthonomonadaceae bacterium]
MKKLGIGVFLSVFIGVVVLPFGWVLWSSLKTGEKILGAPWELPSDPQWQNFANAWQKAGIGTSFINSLLVTLASLIILVPISAMAAYVFAKYPFKGSKLIQSVFMGQMMVPHFLVIVPLFFLLRDFHMLDSLWGLTVVYVAYSLSFTIFVLGGFFHALPNELMEAALLDGCTHSSTFWKVMLPLAKPGLLVVAIFVGIGLWNEYSLALVIVPSPEKKTLPLGIANLTMTQQYQSDWGALFAGLVIVMAPVLIVYWLFRDKIHEAMLAGAVKG